MIRTTRQLIQSQPRVGRTPSYIYRIALAGLSLDEILARDCAPAL